MLASKAMSIILSQSAQHIRERIIEAASTLLTEGGSEAVSTRAVGAAAGVQAPTIYRIFTDKRGLLNAVAEHALTTYVAGKATRQPSADPVEDLRAGWDRHIEFGLTHPAAYVLAYGDTRPDHATPPAVAASAKILAEHIHRVAQAGRLRISEERAAHLVHAAGSGTTLALIGLSEERRDPGLSVLAREAVLAAIITDARAGDPPGPVGAAVTLRALLPQTGALTTPEQHLLREWLDRIANPTPAHLTKPPITGPS